MKEESIKNLFISELKDMLSGEEQIVEALPEMIEAAECQELREAFESHLNETREQVKRLKKILKTVGAKGGAEPCEAMEGLIKECQEAIEAYEPSALRDAALISKAQRIEHYEISVYGTLRTFAKELGHDEIQNLLQDSLDEEANADKALTKIAEGGMLTAGVNYKANHPGEV